MNAEIKELLLQAGIKFDKDIEDIDVCVMLPSDLEKFAELIVRQCLATCVEVERDYRIDRTTTVDFELKNIFAEGENACTKIHDLIKDRFAVK